MVLLCAHMMRWRLQKVLLRQNRSRALSQVVKQIHEQGRIETFKLSQSAEQLDQTTIEKVKHKENIKQSLSRQARDVITYLLPKGYPSSVRKGYAQFAVGQLLSNTLSTAAGVLSMQALLYAMGIGMSLGAGTAPLAATLNWVIKDGLGQLGGVLFASFVNNRFDADPKRWRLTATVAMDSASFMEMLTPLAPAYFLPIASVANVSKNISYLAASASRAAIHRSFMLEENLADVTAKTGSQFIVSSLIGTSLGVGLSGLVTWGVAGATPQYECTVALYCALSSVSIAVTYLSLRYVTITSLSPQRLDYVMHHYLLPVLHGRDAFVPVVDATNASSSASSEKAERTGELSSSDLQGREEEESYWVRRQLVSPEELRLAEAVLGVPPLLAPESVPLTCTTSPSSAAGQKEVMLPSLRVGCDLHEVVSSATEYETLSKMYEEEAFLISAVVWDTGTGTAASSGPGTERQAEVHVLFKERATHRDIVRAMVQAFVARSLLWREGYTARKRGWALPWDTSTRASATITKRRLRLDVLERALQNERPSGLGGECWAEILRHLEDKLMSDKDWRISSTMLETRFARLAAE